MAVRNALLKYLRVNVNAFQPLQNPRPGVGGLSQLISRNFSEEARGSFLDKPDVTDRVLNVVKTFQKVDPSKSVDIDALEKHGWLDHATHQFHFPHNKIIPRRKVTPNAHFKNDLGLDSLDTVEVVMALEEEFCFEIPDNEADKIHSINLAIDFIASHPQAK